MNAEILAEINTIPQVVALNNTRAIAKAYAMSYSPDSGDTVREYIDRAACDVFPATFRAAGERAEFKRLIRHYMRERGAR